MPVMRVDHADVLAPREDAREQVRGVRDVHREADAAVLEVDGLERNCGAVTAVFALLDRGGAVLAERRVERQGRQGERLQLLAESDDPRVTRVGNFMRKTRIDELPQILNVFKGEMSFVGPRPERPYFVEQLIKVVPYYNVRHSIKPGITGWAQVNGWRGNTSLEKRIEFDLYYIENWSLTLDFKIMWLTLVKGFFHKHAY